jgi:hypothetical protein
MFGVCPPQFGLYRCWMESKSRHAFTTDQAECAVVDTAVVVGGRVARHMHAIDR